MNKYIERSLTYKLTELIKYFPAVAISGARQTGKSTWLEHVLGPQARIVTFDPIIDVGNARQDPELFLRSRRPNPHEGVRHLILDEIQYVPQLVPVLKRIIDEDRTPGQYLLTGSQQWEVMKSLSESLAGRVVFLDLEGFNLSEIAQATESQSWLEQWMEDPERFTKSAQRLPDLARRSVHELIWRGAFPATQFLPLEMAVPFFSGYLKTYIERDVRLLADVSDWELFGRFVRLCAALSAQEINFSQLGRDLGLTPQTAKRWIGVLKSTFQWFEVPAFSLNATKKISEKPKGYFADTGFLCFAQAISSPDALAGHPLWGAIFETAVAAEIRKQIALMKFPPHFYHWRAHSGAEVDFILERDGMLFPIEVKAKSNPSRNDLTGIQSFRKHYEKAKIQKGLVIAPTREVSALSELDYAMPWDISSQL